MREEEGAFRVESKKRFDSKTFSPAESSGDGLSNSLPLEDGEGRRDGYPFQIASICINHPSSDTPYLAYPRQVMQGQAVV